MTTIVCFGDSNTWGSPPFENLSVPPARLPKSQRWPQIMAAGAGDNIDVIEEGLGSRTTVFDDPIEGKHKNGSRLIVACLETHAPIDLLVIMLGTNEFKVQFNVSAFNSARGILTLMQKVKGHYAALSERCPEILIVTPPALGKQAEPVFWGDALLRSEGHAEYLHQISERTGCFHFDSNKVTTVGEDGVHLTGDGHKALGNALACAFRSIRPVIPTTSGHLNRGIRPPLFSGCGA